MKVMKEAETNSNELSEDEEQALKLYNLSDEEWRDYTKIFYKITYTYERPYESKNERIKKLLISNWSLTAIPIVFLLCYLSSTLLLFAIYLAGTLYYNIFQYKFIRLEKEDIAIYYILGNADAKKYVKHNILVTDLELEALLKREKTNIFVMSHLFKKEHIQSVKEKYPQLFDTETESEAITLSEAETFEE